MDLAALFSCRGHADGVPCTFALQPQQCAEINAQLILRPEPSPCAATLGWFFHKGDRHQIYRWPVACIVFSRNRASLKSACLWSFSLSKNTILVPSFGHDPKTSGWRKAGEIRWTWSCSVTIQRTQVAPLNWLSLRMCISCCCCSPANWSLAPAVSSFPPKRFHWRTLHRILIFQWWNPNGSYIIDVPSDESCDIPRSQSSNDQQSPWGGLRSFLRCPSSSGVLQLVEWCPYVLPAASPVEPKHRWWRKVFSSNFSGWWREWQFPDGLWSELSMLSAAQAAERQAYFQHFLCWFVDCLVCICLAEKFGEGEPSVFSYVFPQLPRRLKHYWSPNGCWDGARGRCEQCSWTLCERLWRRPSQCTVWIGRICHSPFLVIEIFCDPSMLELHKSSLCTLLKRAGSKTTYFGQGISHTHTHI